MDSARKRKAAGSISTPSSTSKRIKLLNSNHAAPTTPAPIGPDVRQIGLKLVGMLRNASDKTGRSIAGAFLSLPAPAELPEYYEQIKLPIAIDTIEEKLLAGAYPTVTTVESDVKRMIQNAKDFNIPKSEIYEDAERMRKLAYNYMKVNNPAYKLDPSYSSFPTPVPLEKAKLAGQAPRASEQARQSTGEDDKAQRGRTTKSSEPRSQPKPSMDPSEDPRESVVGNDEEGPDYNFEGKSFQEAQQIIISELLSHADVDGLEIFTPFVNLPSRKLEDYYKLIRHPVSIKSVQKRTRGQHGRASPTGVSDFKTWDAFEEEISYIWKNAREYNEDGSEMYELANDFETLVKTRIAEAKEKVEEPASMRIKLGAPKAKSGITLNLSQHRGSPVPMASVDNEGPSKQKPGPPSLLDDKPHPATNGTPSTAAKAKSPEKQIDEHHPSAAVKHERTTTSSPVPTLASTVQVKSANVNHSTSDPDVPPPHSRMTSASPLPPSQAPAAPSALQYATPLLLPPTAMRTYSVDAALLPVVTLSTLPGSNSKPYNLPVYPHAFLASQNAAFTLPAAHSVVQIMPTISRELSAGRTYKLFLSLNGVSLLQQNTQLNTESGRRTHTYDGRLVPGVNRIDVEIAATKPDKPESVNKGLDVERLTVFVNLLR